MKFYSFLLSNRTNAKLILILVFAGVLDVYVAQTNGTLSSRVNSTTKANLTTTSTVNKRITTATTASTQNTDPSPENLLESFRTEADKNIKDGKEKILKLSAAVGTLEKSSIQIRNDVNGNITSLQAFKRYLEDDEIKFADKWEIKLLLDEAKSEVQNLINSFTTISDRLHKLMPNN